MAKYRSWFIMKIVEHIDMHGNRDAVMRLNWPTPATLCHQEIVEFAWQCPPARCRELECYKKQFGAEEEKWRAHMLEVGDREVMGPGGVQLVELNEERVWTRTKRFIQQAVLTQDQGGSELDQQLIKDRAAVLGDSLANRASSFDACNQDLSIG